MPALTRRSHRVLLGLTFAFVVTLTAFFVWWVSPVHRLSWPGFVANSVLLAIVLASPLYFLYIVNQMRRVNPNVPVPDVRVAMVVTKAPSEPWPMVQATLEAMLAQDYPGDYDVWLADEDPAGRQRISAADLTAAPALQGGQPRLLLRPLRVCRV